MMTIFPIDEDQSAFGTEWELEIIHPMTMLTVTVWIVSGLLLRYIFIYILLP
jgi:hypothetical protein